jgi:hypothetical protein
MADFVYQITNFQTNGNYNYQLDEAGNVVLNPSSSVFQQNYIAFPTVNYQYDADKIVSFYEPTLKEFQPAPQTGSIPTLPQDIIEQINSITQQNQILQNQLDSMISESELDSAVADQQAIKDIVISLRIQLGQGSKSSDFQSDFPYLPIPVDQRDLAL